MKQHITISQLRECNINPVFFYKLIYNEEPEEYYNSHKNEIKSDIDTWVRNIVKGDESNIVKKLNIGKMIQIIEEKYGPIDICPFDNLRIGYVVSVWYPDLDQKYHNRKFDPIDLANSPKFNIPEHTAKEISEQRESALCDVLWEAVKKINA